MKWFLPVLFIMYYGGVSVFTHVHIEYGTTIVHAHPFKKASDGSTHHHASLAEIQLFHTLSSLHAVDGAVHPLRLRFFTNQIFIFSESLAYPDYIAVVEGWLYLRPPPVV